MPLINCSDMGKGGHRNVQPPHERKPAPPPVATMPAPPEPQKADVRWCFRCHRFMDECLCIGTKPCSCPGEHDGHERKHGPPVGQRIETDPVTGQQVSDENGHVEVSTQGYTYIEHVPESYAKTCKHIACPCYTEINRKYRDLTRDLEGDEIKVLEQVAHRLRVGKTFYGQLVLADDARDWVQEGREELLDMAVYLACHVLKPR